MSVNVTQITIVLNGETTAVHTGTTVARLLAHLEIDPRRCAVERNRELVRKASYAEVVLVEGDQVEVVTLVGGG